VSAEPGSVLTLGSNADAVVDLGGSLTFVEPHETSETFEEFLAYVREDSTRCWGKTPTVNVKYAQTRKCCYHLQTARVAADRL